MNRYKKLVLNTIIFGIGSFGSKILILLLTRLYTGNINPSDNSTKELLEMTANFLIPVISFSLTNALIRYGIDKDYDDREVFSSGTIMQILGFVLLLVISPLIWLLPYTHGYVIMLCAYIMSSCLHSHFAQFLRSQGKVKLFAFDGVLAAFTLFIFNVVFIAKIHLGVTGFMISVILSDFTSAVFLWFAGKLWNYFSIKYYNAPLAKKMMKFSIPLIPTTLLWTITGFSDRLFLRYQPTASGFTGATAAGVYSVSSKIPNLISTFSTIFFQAWNMSAIEENKTKDRAHFYEQVSSVYSSIMFIASAFLIAFVKPLSNLLIDSSNFPEYANAYKYTPVLVIAVLMMCFNEFLSSIYQTTQKTTHSFWTALIAAGLNIILNFILIPIYGIMGAVAATFASYFVCYLVRIVDTRKLIYFKVNHVFFYINIIILFLMCVNQSRDKSNLIINIISFVFIIIINFKAVITMFQKILAKRKHRRAN